MNVFGMEGCHHGPAKLGQILLRELNSVDFVEEELDLKGGFLRLRSGGFNIHGEKFIGELTGFGVGITDATMVHGIERLDQAFLHDVEFLERDSALIELAIAQPLL